MNFCFALSLFLFREKMRQLVFCVLVFANFVPHHVNSANSISFQRPSDCKRGTSDQIHEFFDFSQMRCVQCSQDSQFQTVSEDGLRCVCRPAYRIVMDFGGSSITCNSCDAEKVTSMDQWNCVGCGADNLYNAATDQCTACAVEQIEVERKLDGSWDQPTPTRTCQSCSRGTMPSEDGTRCVRCNQILSVDPTLTDCICPQNRWTGGVCFKDSQDIVDISARVQFTSGVTVDSAYFRYNAQAADGMCNVNYANLTACQTLGNLCTMIMYTRENENSGTNDACSRYLAIASGETGRATIEWPENMPWLYYLEDDADTILTATRIPTQYTFPNSNLKFIVAAYTLNGTFLGYKPVTGGLLQLCRDSDNVMDAAYSFGTTFTQSCIINVRDLFSEEKYPVVFYDMYLEFEEDGRKQLYAVPVLVKNYKDKDGGEPNREGDRSKWQLTRRFFLVDNISGKPEGSSTSSSTGTTTTTTTDIPRAVRYAKNIKINIQLQKDTNEGKIYPPYLEINYAAATFDDYEADQNVTVTFDVGYSMDLTKYKNDIGIALGVLCALGIVYGGLQTWGWNKRAGKLGIDFISILKFVLYSLHSISNVFFVVSLGSAVWWITFYKRQNTVYLIVPNNDQDNSFVAYLATAFALKLIQLAHLIYSQCNVDIFLVDWERPKGKVMGSDAQSKGAEPSVSIWRTYFVANEWNEIQTTRRINEIFQLFAVIFFLNVVGFENMATMDPFSQLNRGADRYFAPDSIIFRFAIAGLTYLIIGIVQWIFYTFIYERFIEDQIRQYVDLCSMSNISIFILQDYMYGYYIHGRSIFGHADTGMREMYINLEKEKKDLCGKRGLEPNTDEQTFQIAIPRNLRQQYDRVMRPIREKGVNQPAGAAPRGGLPPSGELINEHTERMFQAYDTINRFLQAFINHSVKDVDYNVRDKLLFESILDVEFKDTTDRDGYFLNDSGHSFDNVLFFGHETTLIIFEILLFGLVDVLAKNYVLAAVITYIVMEIVCWVRNSMGQANLANKTLVDKRFLI